MIHLHTHSNFSFLDGASPSDRLVRRAKELGMEALALTDHHGLYGVVRFQQAARAYGIKPIVGVEVCVRVPNAPHSGPFHLVLLARNQRGYGNLCRIVTRAQLDHQDDPQILLADIAQYREGLVALSGCRRGEIAHWILAGRRDRAMRAAEQYLDVFGEHFRIELQHHLLADDDVLVHALLDISKSMGIPCTISNNVHYALPHEYRLRDVVACIQTRSTLDEWNDIRHANGEYYLKTEAQMRTAFRLPDTIFDACVAETHAIADSCHVELLAVACRPPDFPVPPAETAFSYLHHLCQKQVRELYKPLTPKVSNQLAYELSIIEQMGLASFFLCVWDIVHFAREQGIRCAGRGSAADSIVAYILGITAVDPIANNLLFERFLNPGRVGMPDVDIDFDSVRRDEVIQYIQNRYTTEHAAMVANVITYRSRSAFRDVAKVMGFSPSLIDHLASKLSYRSVRQMREDLNLAGIMQPSLAGTSPAVLPSRADTTGSLETHMASTGNNAVLPVAQHPAVRDRLPSNPLDEQDGTALDLVVELCEQLDGYPRHLSLHNGGLLITSEPLVDVVPMEYATSGVRVCQFNKDDVEAMGLIKFDILGLRTLSIVSESVQMIREARGIDLPIDDLTLDDPAVYDMICSTKTIGVFQVESPGQWALLSRSQPENFNDLIIQISLFRPGPLQGGMVNPYVERRSGQQQVTYPHPSLENCLRDTLGVVVFQEQVLQVAHDFAGLSYTDADGLRRAMSHYRTDAEMNVCRQAFVESAVALGRDRTLAEQLYESIAYFSGYGFCRSHAAAFAKTVYQTAFLKTYYPAEFLAAILSNEPCCYYPTQTVIEEARRWGLQVLPVDINKSRSRYAPEHGAIRMGFLQVKGVTEDVGLHIEQARERYPFRSLADFWQRTELHRDAVENLVAVGAFDSLGTNRRTLLWQLEEVVQMVPRSGDQAPALYGSGWKVPAPRLPPLTQLDVAGLDFTLQGASARYSIMAFYRRSLMKTKVPSIGQLQGRPVGTLVRTAGVVISRQQPPTAKGMTFLVLADEEGELPVAIYPDVYAEYRQVVNSSASLIIEGTVQRERYLVSLLATRVWRLNDVATMDTNILPSHHSQSALVLGVS